MSEHTGGFDDSEFELDASESALREHESTGIQIHHHHEIHRLPGVAERKQAYHLAMRRGSLNSVKRPLPRLQENFASDLDDASNSTDDIFDKSDDSFNMDNSFGDFNVSQKIEYYDGLLTDGSEVPKEVRDSEEKLAKERLQKWLNNGDGQDDFVLLPYSALQKRYLTNVNKLRPKAPAFAGFSSCSALPEIREEIESEIEKKEQLNDLQDHWYDYVEVAQDRGGEFAEEEKKVEEEVAAAEKAVSDEWVDFAEKAVKTVETAQQNNPTNDGVEDDNALKRWAREMREETIRREARKSAFKEKERRLSEARRQREEATARDISHGFDSSTGDISGGTSVDSDGFPEIPQEVLDMNEKEAKMNFGDALQKAGNDDDSFTLQQSFSTLETKYINSMKSLGPSKKLEPTMYSTGGEAAAVSLNEDIKEQDKRRGMFCDLQDRWYDYSEHAQDKPSRPPEAEKKIEQEIDETEKHVTQDWVDFAEDAVQVVDEVKQSNPSVKLDDDNDVTTWAKKMKEEAVKREARKAELKLKKKKEKELKKRRAREKELEQELDDAAFDAENVTMFDFSLGTIATVSTLSGNNASSKTYEEMDREEKKAKAKFGELLEKSGEKELTGRASNQSFTTLQKKYLKTVKSLQPVMLEPTFFSSQSGDGKERLKEINDTAEKEAEKKILFSDLQDGWYDYYDTAQDKPDDEDNKEVENEISKAEKSASSNWVDFAEKVVEAVEEVKNHDPSAAKDADEAIEKWKGEARKTKEEKVRREARKAVLREKKKRQNETKKKRKDTKKQKAEETDNDDDDDVDFDEDEEEKKKKRLVRKKKEKKEKISKKKEKKRKEAETEEDKDDSAEWTNPLKSWTNKPKTVRLDGSKIVFKPTPRSDCFRRSENIVNDNANFFWHKVEGDFDVVVRIKGTFKSSYDKAGIMLRENDKTWVISGIEMYKGRLNHSSSITRGVTDWSLAPLPDDAKNGIWICVKRAGGKVECFYSFDMRQWTQTRQGLFTTTPSLRVGIVGANPGGEAFIAYFEKFTVRKVK